MITIIDYRAGNIASVQRALDSLKISNKVESDPDEIRNAERLLFPGVGNAESAMEHLRGLGLAEAIRDAHKKGTPILGVCLGSQIILDHSEEGDADCLGLLPGEVWKLTARPGIKVPHMGWNNLILKQKHSILEGVADETFYFVHSYYTKPADSSDIYAECEHGEKFAVVIGRDNLVATQFHPEKSGPAGLKLLENFAGWRA